MLGPVPRLHVCMFVQHNTVVSGGTLGPRCHPTSSYFSAIPAYDYEDSETFQRADTWILLFQAVKRVKRQGYHKSLNKVKLASFQGPPSITPHGDLHLSELPNQVQVPQSSCVDG